MEQVESRVLKWGHSLGVVIPKDKVRSYRLKAGEKIQFLLLKRNNILKKMFGSFKFKEPIEKIMKESDELLYNDR